MGSAWHEFSALGRPAARWGSLLAMLLVAACGGDRDAAPAGDQGSVATVDTATTAPAAPTADTAASPGTTDPAAPKPAAPKPAPSAQAQDTSAGTQTPSQPQQAEAPLRDAYHQAPRDTIDQATYDGWKQYNLNCARCHGEDVLGTTIAPHLIVSLKPDGPINTQELFVQVVCAGRPEKGMPAWCALGMDPVKINQIYSYVKGRSEGKIGPGRPAVRQGG